MTDTDDISTEEILASIRTILLEKEQQKMVDDEKIFELTKEMIFKKSKPENLDDAADEMLARYALILNAEEKENVRVSVKTDL